MNSIYLPIVSLVNYNFIGKERYMHKILHILGFFFLSLTVQAQSLLKGKIYDLSNNQALAGATIYNPQSQQGITTDAGGYFEIAWAANLEVSLLGYEKQTIAVKEGSEFLSIGLKASHFALNEIVVTGYQSERKLIETSAAVSLITEQALHRDNDLLITPALNRVPGIYMHAGTLNTNRIVIRGIGSRSLFSTNKVRAYLNDIPLTSGEGETSVEDIDLAIIDRVEVIKGPASSIYGAGLGGTINLKTKKADFQSTSLKNENIFGSYGLWRSVSSFRYGGNKSNLNLIYSKTHSDGYRENNEYDRHSLTALGQFFPDEKTSVTVLANLVSLKAFIPSSIDSLTFVNNPRAAAFTWAQSKGFEDYEKLLMGISLEHDFDSDWSVTSSLFGSFRNSNEPRPFNILREANQTYGVRTSLNFNPDFGDLKTRFSLGGEYFKEWYHWRTYQNNNRTEGAILSDNEEIRSYYNLFLSSEWQFGENWIFSAGVNLNETRYTLTDLFVADSLNQSGEYGFDPIFSPRVGLTYKIRENLAVFATASHGFSPPSVAETLTPNGQINPDIQPETGWNYEIGSRGNLFSGKFSYDISLYTMQIENLLVARRTAEDAFVGVNAGKTTHNGLEVALNYALYNRPEKFSVQAFANYTLADYHFREFIDQDRDFSGNQLTGVPRNTFNLGLDAQSRLGFYGNINFQFIDEIPIKDDNTLYADAYALLNLKAGFQKIVFNHLEINIFGGIQNLTDTRYASMLLINAVGAGNNAPRYYYPGLPRNYFGGLSLGYRF